MTQFFAPAVRVMNRLKYPQKFILVGVLLLIPTVLLLFQYVVAINEDIEFAENERFGVEYAEPMFAILHRIQQHAVYAQLVQSGQTAYAADLERSRDEIGRLFDVALETDARLSEYGITPELRRLRAGWLLLVSQSGGWGVDQTMDAHLALQQQLMRLLTTIGNQSKLILDPSIDSYYLMDAALNRLPAMMMYLSRIETTGARLLLDSSASQRLIDMRSYQELLSTSVEASINGFQFVFADNATVRDRLKTEADEVSGQSRAFLLSLEHFNRALTRLDLFLSAASATRESYAALFDRVTQELSQTLAARQDTLEGQRNIVLIVSAVAVLASVYFFTGFYLAVRRTIDALAETSASMIRGSVRQSVVLENRDELAEVVTAFNDVANEMLQARDRALKANRLKDEFLATMSHELRTPLSSIIGYTGILMSGMRGSIDDTARGLLGRVRESSQHLLNLINDILDLAKIEAGRMELVETPFALRDFITSLQGQTEVLARQKQLNFEVVINPEVPDAVHGDSEKIGQLLRNLLSNAIKFTEEGVVRLNVYALDRNVHFEVTDTGIGIPPQALEYIFDEFRQVDGTTRRVYGGTGLGLAIVRKLCLSMGGRITVHSRQGVGSTFTAILPLIETDRVVSPEGTLS